MTTTSSFHHMMCCNYPRFTVWCCCSVWRRLPVLIPISSFLTLSVGKSCHSQRSTSGSGYALLSSCLLCPIPSPPPISLNHFSLALCLPLHHSLCHSLKSCTYLHLRKKCFNWSLFLLCLQWMELFVHTLSAPDTLLPGEDGAEGLTSLSFSQHVLWNQRSLWHHMYWVITEYIAVRLQAN